MGKVPQKFNQAMDASAVIEAFDVVLPTRTKAALKKGAARAAYQLQEMMREELNRMVYSTPPGSYQRTETLLRATYAARPGAEHSRDHDAAFAGHDLRVDEGNGGIARVRGAQVDIDIGSWANWAWHVHEGHGNNPGPRPFSERPLKEAPKILDREIGQAIAESLVGLIR